MNQSYIGLVLIVVVVCVYTFYSSNYAYVSTMKDKHGLTHSVNRVNWKNVKELSRNNLSQVVLRLPSSLLTTEADQEPGSGNSINICCDIDQMIDATSNDCVDVKIEMTNKVDYLLRKFVVNSNMGQGVMHSPNFMYGFDLNYGCANSEIVRFEWTDNKTNFYFIDQDNGNLIEVNHKTRKIVSIFSSKAYCLDQSLKDGTYVALVCPCIEKSCIPKCCQKGYYFNIKENVCKHEAEDDIQSYSPDLYNNKEVTEVGNHYLIHKQPECDNHKLFIESELDLRPLYVQENGSLMAQFKDDKNYYFSSNKYCIDMFSTGKENETFVNGFYCSIDEKAASNVKEPSTVMNEREIRKEFLLFENISNQNFQQMDLSYLNRSKLAKNKQVPEKLLPVQDGRSCEEKTEKITISLAFEMICMSVVNHLIIRT